jgi:23S rRNA (adenine2030-N6)-methyltransferase
MANQHFGNLGDVWKHLVVAEVLALERPRLYCETHAGTASYALTHSPARDFGVYRILDGGAASPAIASSRYYAELVAMADSGGDSARYPGSALLAMSVLGVGSEYLFFDLDPQSIDSLRDAARSLALTDFAQCEREDGLAAVRDACLVYSGDPANVVVHIDPFDPFEETDPGLSAVGLASELAGLGFKVVYWYGYDEMSDRGWPSNALNTRVGRSWCGESLSDITSIVGAGVFCLNMGRSTIYALQSLGAAVASLYATTGNPGDEIDFADL